MQDSWVGKEDQQRPFAATEEPSSDPRQAGLLKAKTNGLKSLKSFEMDSDLLQNLEQIVSLKLSVQSNCFQNGKRPEKAEAGQDAGPRSSMCSMCLQIFKRHNVSSNVLPKLPLQHKSLDFVFHVKTPRSLQSNFAHEASFFFPKPARANTTSWPCVLWRTSQLK